MRPLASAPGAVTLTARSCFVGLIFGLLAVAAPASSAEPPPSAAPPPSATVIGPAADQIRPDPNPVDVTALSLPPSVHRDWLQQDREMIGRLRSVLPPPASIAALLRALALPGARETDLGFGFKLHLVTAGGGYASCTLTAASHTGAIVSLRIDCGASEGPETLAALRPSLERMLGSGFARHPQSSSMRLWEQASYRFPTAEAAARATLDRELGSLEPVDASALSPALREAYDKLLSPEDELAVGASCGFAGTDPPGHEAATTLRSANRADLLRNVLRGPNPGGRVYAARALEDLGAVRAEDAAVIEKLARLSIDVQSCSGCMFSQITSAEAFRRK